MSTRLNPIQRFVLELKKAIEKQKEEGFTLIELLLAIGIIAIISSIVIVAINPTANIQEAQTRVGQKQSREIQSAIIQYMIDHGAAPNGITDTPQILCSDGFVPTDGDCEISLKNALANNTDSEYSFISEIPQHPAFTPPNSGHSVSFDGSRYTVTPLEVAQTLSKIYFIDDSDGEVKRANLGGGTVETVYVGATTPAIAFDKVNNKVYLLEASAAEVFSMDYDGSNSATVADLSAYPGLFSNLQLLPSLEKIYFNIVNGSSLTAYRMDYDGSNLEDIYNGTLGMEIDEVNGYIYFVDNNGYNNGVRYLYRVGLDGGNKTTIYTLNTGCSGPFCLEFNYRLQQPFLDLNAGKVYFYERNDATHYIKSANADGTGSATVLTSPTAVIEMVGDVTNEKLYWTGANDNIYWANFDGSGMEVLIGGLDTPAEPTLDTQNSKLYYTTGDAGSDDVVINRCDLDGTNCQAIINDGYRMQLLFDSSL